VVFANPGPGPETQDYVAREAVRRREIDILERRRIAQPGVTQGETLLAFLKSSQRARCHW
jgi:hypothetical protein